MRIVFEVGRKIAMTVAKVRPYIYKEGETLI